MNFKSLWIQHKYRFLLTIGLILLEATILILFPLFIGDAIDGAIHNEYSGAIQLGVLGFSLLVIGAGRRMFDSRFYAKVYQNMGVDAIGRLKDKEASIKTARLGMIKELMEFLENSLPEFINNTIGLVGIIAILAALNLNVFYGSLVVSIIIFFIYGLGSNKTMRYNERTNNELERQVDVVSKNLEDELSMHLKEMMKWNIKLSDLEVVNFSFSWMVAVVFLVVSIIISVGDGIVQYGALFALVMYVFQYIENIINLPLFYQNLLRLKEIVFRLRRT